MNRFPGRWIALAAGLVFAASVVAQDATLSRARQLMEQRNPAAAYSLLKPLEGEQAGNPEYDYLLGIAALDAGRLTEAVFALERVLAVRPDHAQARAEIGRAYYQLGEVETARRELEAVRQQTLPPDVALTIQKFLDAIDQAQASTRTSVSGYVELGLGYDTNVNSGTASSQVAIPAFAGFGLATLNAAALKQSDGYGSVAAGVNVRHPVRPGLAVFAGADGSQRMHFDKSAFDLGSVGGHAGVEVVESGNKFTVALQAQSLLLDWNRFRESVGATGQWQRQLGAAGMFTGYLQYAQLRYPGQDTRNADRTVGGVAYAHAFGGNLSPVGYAGIYYGHEDERDATRADFGHRVYGIRLGGQLTFSERIAAFASLSYEDRAYGGATPGFVDNRADRQTDFALGVSYTPSKAWVITPQVTYTDNRSNVPFTDYDRTQAQVTVRRIFR